MDEQAQQNWHAMFLKDLLDFDEEKARDGRHGNFKISQMITV